MSKDTPIGRFLDAVARAARPPENRGLLADLRHGFGDATSHRAWPHIAPYCHLDDDRERIIWLTVSAGAATAAGAGVPPPASRWHNLGDTMHDLALGTGVVGKSDDVLRSYAGRFRRLITCATAVSLCAQLPTILRAAANKGVPVRYERLFWDLCYWEERKARVRWAARYWHDKQDAAPAADAPEKEDA